MGHASSGFGYPQVMVSQYPTPYYHHQQQYYVVQQHAPVVHIRRYSMRWGGAPQVQAYRVRSYEYEDAMHDKGKVFPQINQRSPVISSNQDNLNHTGTNTEDQENHPNRLPLIDRGTDPSMMRSKSSIDLRNDDSDDCDSDDGLNYKDRINAIQKRHARERGELTKKQAMNRAQMDQKMSFKLRERRERREKSEPRRLSVMLKARPESANYASTRISRK